jgi:hypothetical protein
MVSVKDALANRPEYLGSGWHMEQQLNPAELELREKLEAMSDFEILAVMSEI